MAKTSYSWMLKFVLAIVFYIILNKYVVWHLQHYVGEYFDPNVILISYWILAAVTLLMVVPFKNLQKPIQYIGCRFLEVLIYLTITYITVDVLYLICDIFSFDKRNLVEYVGGVTFFVVVGVVMFGNQSLSRTLVNRYTK